MPRRESRIDPHLLEQAKPVIEQIADAKKRNGAFAYFAGADVAQEVWIICLKALEQYEASKGRLENYLRRCVTNRLKNLKRDRYFRFPRGRTESDGEVQDRINIVNALPLGCGEIAEGGKPVACSAAHIDPAEIVAAEELRQYIESRMPADLVADFQRLLAGERMAQSKIAKVRRAVAEVLKEADER